MNSQPSPRRTASRGRDTDGLPMNGYPGGVFAGYRHLDASQAVVRGAVPPFPALVTAGDATPVGRVDERPRSSLRPPFSWPRSASRPAVNGAGPRWRSSFAGWPPAHLTSDSYVRTRREGR
jgi:hypothetical protein